jgi:hypothetical protein
MPKSTYLADKILGFIFRDDTWTKPTNVYWALASADLTAANVTANELPIGTGGYARAAVAVANAQWLAPATSGARRVIVNVNQITFGTATANLNGSNPVGFFGIYDAATGGNLLYYGTISTPAAILSGQPIAILAGAAQVLEG